MERYGEGYGQAADADRAPAGLGDRGLTRRQLLGATGALGAAGALALAGCASSGGGSGGGSGKLKLGIAVANISLNFAHEMVLGAQSAAQHSGHASMQPVGPANTDGPAEVQLLQNLSATATDGIIVFNLDPPIFVRPEAQIIAKGIPVIALDTSPSNGSGVTYYVGNDNWLLGQTMAEQTLKHLGSAPHGTVVIGEPNPGTPVLDDRVAGIKDTLRKQAPGITALGPYQTYSDPGQNYSAWSSQVHAHPSALAFLGVGDADSYNLAKIKTSEGGKYLTAGFDVDPKTLDAVKAGSNFCTIDPHHFLKGYVATWTFIDRLRNHGGKLAPGWLLIPGGVVDSSNIDAIIAREKSAAASYDWYRTSIDGLLSGWQSKLKPLGQAR
jgi:ribose transport system substrate-binding protein